MCCSFGTSDFSCFASASRPARPPEAAARPWLLRARPQLTNHLFDAVQATVFACEKFVEQLLIEQLARFLLTRTRVMHAEALCKISYAWVGAASLASLASCVASTWMCCDFSEAEGPVTTAYWRPPAVPGAALVPLARRADHCARWEFRSRPAGIRRARALCDLRCDVKENPGWAPNRSFGGRV